MRIREGLPKRNRFFLGNSPKYGWVGVLDLFLAYFFGFLIPSCRRWWAGRVTDIGLFLKKRIVWAFPSAPLHPPSGEVCPDVEIGNVRLSSGKWLPCARKGGTSRGNADDDKTKMGTTENNLLWQQTWFRCRFDILQLGMHIQIYCQRRALLKLNQHLRYQLENFNQ